MAGIVGERCGENGKRQMKCGVERDTALKEGGRMEEERGRNCRKSSPSFISIYHVDFLVVIRLVEEENEAPNAALYSVKYRCYIVSARTLNERSLQLSGPSEPP
jgi:hypothetical protein